MAKIDMRSKQEILHEIKERSVSYTPEWNMNTDNPDIATALAYVYADMFSGTLKRLNCVPLKNKIAFYNNAHASLLPASPSRGYVCFSLSSEYEGNTELSKGTVLTADSSADDDGMHFEICDDILVSGTSLEKIIYTDDRRDYISQAVENGKGPVCFFAESGKNVQEHILFISQANIMNLNHKAEITISFYRRGDITVSAELIRKLADNNNAVFEYYTGDDEGYVAFEKAEEQNGRLVLYKGDKQSNFSVTEEYGFSGPFIRITVKDITAAEGIEFSRIELSAEAQQIECDAISDGTTEQETAGFYPFGERFQLYNEIYFGSTEVMSKKGARINLAFNIKFDSVPIENQLPDDAINWKWIANKGDFAKSKSYDISISQVIWEYYNGSGWARLFKDNSYENVFNISQGVTEHYCSVSFVCPEDISPFFIGSVETLYIRARILKAENLYKVKGQFLSPKISNVSFEYHYNGYGLLSDYTFMRNNADTVTVNKDNTSESGGFRPFIRTGQSKSSMYLGFSSAPDKGPFRMLWDIREVNIRKTPELKWEFMGGNGWRQMNMADETASFTRNGLTIFLDNSGFRKVNLFGNELYWIRVTDNNDCFSDGITINNIYLNAVKAVNNDERADEYFSVDAYQENLKYELSKKHILDFSLYVDEADTLTDNEQTALKNEGRFFPEYDDAGMMKGAWVLWQETDTFISENSSSRCYVIDKNSGVFMFGNGKNGKIPVSNGNGGIHAVYTVGGGTRTNVLSGQINRMEQSDGFISAVNNPMEFSGGCDIETLQASMERNAVMIRTQGKAITARDFEALAKYAVRTIRRVRCFSGYNRNGEKEKGAVTLVAVNSDFTEFEYIRDRIWEYLKYRIPGNLLNAEKLSIIEPEKIHLDISVNITLNGINNVFKAKKDVTDKLNAFLDSESGSFTGRGWQIGQLPDEQQIRSAIAETENIVFINNIVVSAYIVGKSGASEIDMDTVKRHKYFLVSPGNFEIITTVG